MRLAYMRFCVHFGRRYVPADSITIVTYAVFLCRSLKPSSIPSYLNIIRLIHLDAGYPDPLHDNFALACVKRGIKRVLGCTPKQKLPITPAVLLKMKSVLCFDDPVDVTFWCACLVAFYAFFRKSTLVPKAKSADYDKSLRLNDAEFRDNSLVVLHVSHTKTIQYHERILEVPFVACPGSDLDPVESLVKLRNSIPEKFHEVNPPLFSYVKNGKLDFLVYNTFVAKLKQCLSSAGYDASLYSGHSFRRGGATFSFEIGLPAHLIKLRGDWRSNCYERYITVPRSINEQMARALVLAAA